VRGPHLFLFFLLLSNSLQPYPHESRPPLLSRRPCCRWPSRNSCASLWLDSVDLAGYRRYFDPAAEPRAPILVPWLPAAISVVRHRDPWLPPPRASTSMSSVAHIPSYFAAPHGILSSSQKPPRARSFLPSPLPMGVGCWCRRSDSQPFGTVAAEPSLATEQAQMPPCYKLQPLVLQRKGGGKLLMSSLLGAPGAAARSDLGCHLCYQRRARVLPKHAGADTCGRQHCC
jgi:hypothetical protein